VPRQDSRSRTAILALSAALALGLGSVALRGGLAQAQTTPPATTPPATTAQSTTPSTTFSAARARTENERNTVDVVRQAQDGLVYVSVQSGGRAMTGGRATPNSPSGRAPVNPGNQSSQGQDNNQNNPFAGTPFQGLPFGRSGVPDLQNRPSRGTGSGFFINARGDMLTNYHVVEGADSITIRVHNRPETYTARVIGAAPDYDLALIRAEKLPAGLIKPIALGNSDGLEPGLKAIALGAPFDLDFSVTEGIISASARKIPVGLRGILQSVIQTDAAINPGNSGGPLLDSSGQVIGINTQILTGGSDQNAGVGFAIPVNVAKALLPRLQAGTRIVTPTLGIRYADLSALDSAALSAIKLPARGALVTDVLAGSPAQKAGLKAGTQRITLDDGTPLALGGDIITAVDGKPLSTENALQASIFGRTVGDTVKLSVLRGGKTVELSVELSEFNPQASSNTPAN
jgi:serine protease Do